MDKKDQKPMEKWQLIIQWVCAAVWIVAAIADILFDQKLFLTITQCVAALFFTLSAIITTKRYRESHHD